MAAFRFRLQKLLNLKQQMEDKAKNELGLAIKAHELEKQKLSALDTGIMRLSDDFRQACSGTIRPEKIQAIRVWLDVQKTARERQSEAVKRSGENVDKTRVKLIAAMQEKKILSNLKDKELEKFLRQEAMNEQKLTDELVSYKETVKQSSGRTAGL